MPESLIARDPVRDDDWFAARMTNIQFEALSVRLDPRRLEHEAQELLSRRRPRRGAACNEAEVARWLVNGWSTEHLLLTNSEHLTGDALRHSLHWAFPQAYYSVFALTLAYFKSVGYTEMSHTAVIRKFGSDAIAGRYPPAMGFTATGVRQKSFLHLAPAALATSLTFSTADPGLVDGQIAQFMGATRDLDLQEKKKEIRILTARGARKRAFNSADWERVDSALGATSILSLLYRKRIKANYRDIDSLLHEEIDATALYRHLLRLVGAVNFTHELYVACTITCDALERILGRVPIGMAVRPHSRTAHVRRLTS
jgi:hypothetical protein